MIFDSQMDFPQQIYSNHLEEIKSIKFTPREIDVIACILCGRATTIASFLSISPRTVESHLRNIMAKLECNSRERIINFIELSDKYPYVRQYYQSLVILSSFEKKLLEWKSLARESVNQNYNIYFSDFLTKNNVVGAFLSKHFDLLKIPKKNIQHEGETICKQLISSSNDIFNLVIFTKNEYETNLLNTEILTTNKSIQTIFYADIVIIIWRKIDQNKINYNDNLSALENPNNYYFVFLSLLLDVFPSSVLQKIITEFISQYNALKNGLILPSTLETITDHSQQSTQQTLIDHNKQTYLQKLLNIPPHFFYIVVIIFLSSMMGIYVHFYITKQPSFSSSYHSYQTNISQENKVDFLLRIKIFEEIKHKFAQQQGIRTVALVGVGGSGKTTIARNFCLQEITSFAWELNAQNKESLLFSFRQLAETLSDTFDKKTELIRIYQMQESEKKESQLLHFIQSKLKNYQNWLLIFDNVENVSAIKNLIPRDPTTWGKGSIIITSINSTISNGSYLKPENILQIQELSSKEANALFTSILYGKEAKEFSHAQKQQIENFLKQLPSFPLDISIAAHYIKNANLTLDEYIERIKRSNQNFDIMQTKFLSEIGEYNKTRSAIINSSFKNIIDEDRRFIDLLFLISLLDSQQIPKKILELFQEELVVDDFVYHLRKYSIALCNIVSLEKEQIPTLSLHRGTQKHGLLYCLNHIEENQVEAFVGKIVGTIEKFFAKKDKNISYTLLMLPHLDSLITNLEHLPLTPKKIRELQQKLFFIMGYTHWEFSANLMEAKRYLQKVLETGDSTLKPIVLSTLLKDLARICWELCEFEEAVNYSIKSHTIAEKLQGTDLLQADNLVVMGASYLYSNNFNNAYESFTSALSKLNISTTDEKKELAARIHAQIATLYATTYLHRSHISDTERHVYKSLNIIKGNKLFKENMIEQQKISCQVARNKLKLGDILCRINKYQEALSQGFEEAEYIIKNSLDNCSHVLLENRIALGKGESYLRLGNLPEAIDNLTKYINTAENLLGEKNTWTFLSRVLRAEALIRLGKLEEAFNDFKAIRTIDDKINNNYFNLMYITAFYHAAIIKHLQNDPQNSIRYFQEYTSRINEFCKIFLEPTAYQNLLEKKVFSRISPENKEEKKIIKSYFRNSYEIFVAIYGKSHSFITDYVAIQYEKSLDNT